MEAVMLVAKHNGSEILARMAVLRALNDGEASAGADTATEGG